MNKQRILIADDSEMNRAILASILEDEYDIIEAADGKEALTFLQTYHETVSAIILDIVMPHVDGFGVLEEMRKRSWINELPTIMISSESGNAYIDHAFELGASDYISRPFTAGIIRRRIMNAILLHKKKQQLIEVVAEWFAERERDKDVIISILLNSLSERNREEHSHIVSVESLTSIILHRLIEKTDKYMLSHSDIESISAASAVHDIGKILLPHEVVQKKSGLKPEEKAAYNNHTVLGARLVSEIQSQKNTKIAKYAMEICRWHHERWNGKGYPDGLVGDDTPIAAQAVSIANAYDLLSNDHTYEEAFEILRTGGSGSFNPLLIECLADTLESFKHINKKERGDQAHIMAHKTVEDLFANQDFTNSRMSQQLEDANTKIDFISSLSKELWFEYTTQPPSLRISKGATESTGLPMVIIDPQKNSDFISIVGEDGIEAVKKTVRAATPEISYDELIIRIKLKGRPCRCQVAILVQWSGTRKEYTSFIGKVLNVEENYRRLEELGSKAGINRFSENMLIPVMGDGNGCVSITGDQVGLVLKSYRNLFEIVRIVDPGICMQITSESSTQRIEKSKNCFSVWQKTSRCDNCISQEVVRTHKSQSKIETIGNDVFYIVASCLEIDGVPYTLECVNQIRFRGDATNGSENVLNQLLVRNRQVYIDSATKVFNRRYFDDHLRNLTGEYAMAMVDIDEFKVINDIFGHPAGDMALYTVAQTMRSLLRSNDDIVRYGGDEFFILFNNMHEDALARKLEDICEAVRALTFPDYPDLNVHTSIGGCYGSGRVSELIQKADIALYKAKKTRDCVIIYKEHSNDAD